MAQIDTGEEDFAAVRQMARRANHVQRAQAMLAAAGLAAFGIVAVTAAMMTTLF